MSSEVRHQPESGFGATLDVFKQHHTLSHLILAHLLTTPLGVIGLLGLVAACSSQRHAWSLSGVYMLGLLVDGSVPVDALLMSAAVVLTCQFAMVELRLSQVRSLGLMVAAYGLQDLAHYLSGESTMERATWGNLSVNPLLQSGFYAQIFYEIPMILAIQTAPVRALTLTAPLFLWTFGVYATESGTGGSPLGVKRVRALFGTLQTGQDLQNLAKIRDWAMAQDPPKDKTSHWWAVNLGGDTKAAFNAIAECASIEQLFRGQFEAEAYTMDVVEEMNELYISGPNRSGTSDSVFYREHIDGPFYLFPFASVYRCIVGMDANTEVSTIFPMIGKTVVAKTGDVLAFDFNREHHLIQSNTDAKNKQHRIVLKLHYVIYPTRWAVLGYTLRWLTVKYNQAFRALFLQTLAPATQSSKLLGVFGVNGGTTIFNTVNAKCGYANLLYLTAWAIAAILTGSLRVYLIGTQFVHYFRYMSTFFYRHKVDFGVFKRDAQFFKAQAMFSIACLLIFQNYNAAVEDPFKFIAAHWAAILIAVLGNGVAAAAAIALGIDGTLFGIELGQVKAEYRFLDKFPYNCLPHPMILGQIVAMFAYSTLLPTNCTWIISLHVWLYLVHMAQEMYDYHDKKPWYQDSLEKKVA